MVFLENKIRTAKVLVPFGFPVINAGQNLLCSKAQPAPALLFQSHPTPDSAETFRHQSPPFLSFPHLSFLADIFLETYKCAQVLLTPLSDCSIRLHHSLVTAATSSPPTPSLILVQSGSRPHFSMETALLISPAAAPPPWIECVPSS